MNKTTFIKPYPEKEPILVMNSRKSHMLGLSSKKRAYVSFGTMKNFIDIVVNDKIPEDEILLSNVVIENLHLPDYPTFEVCVKGNEIIIGPYIGMLVSEDISNITGARLRKLMIFTEKYEKLHGALVVFALNQVDTANRLIEGYCYNPKESNWQRGIFPYPSAIYRTIGLSNTWQNHFLSALGDKFFNSPYFNKWDMYQWFSTDSDIKRHLPYTILYRSQQDISDMLNKFGKILIKPISGYKGHGIVKVNMENGSIVFRYREDGVNHKAVLDKPDEISRFIENRFHPKRYLIQQAINLLNHNGSIIDFRCAAQKNQSNRWVCNAVIGRCGDRDSIVSNISSGGTSYKGYELLQKVLRLSEKEISAIIKRLESFTVKVCSTLDEYGINCGTLGLDAGIDVDGHLWLIEINNRDPSPQYAKDLNDEALYSVMKASPLLYAKALAGFDSRGD